MYTESVEWFGAYSTLGDEKCSVIKQDKNKTNNKCNGFHNSQVQKLGLPYASGQ